MEAKAWYQSKTIWGLVVVAAGVALSHWNIQVPSDDATTNSLIGVATKIAEVLGLLVALWGRIRAVAPLAGRTPKE